MFDAITKLIDAGVAAHPQPVVQRKAAESIELAGGTTVELDGVKAASLFGVLAALVFEE